MGRTPEAIFDTLYIGSKVESKLEDFSLYEIQFFSYLSCLLSLYDGSPLSFWEYGFVKTSMGSPYSIEIKEAWLFLVGKSSIEKTTEGYTKLTDKGRDEISFYLTLHSFKQREKYLDSACRSLSLIPISYIKDAINNEPVLKSARSVTKKYLLDENSPATHVLYSQFGMLKEALKEKDYKDLLIPAVVFLESLSTELKIEEIG